MDLVHLLQPGSKSTLLKGEPGKIIDMDPDPERSKVVDSGKSVFITLILMTICIMMCYAKSVT